MSSTIIDAPDLEAAPAPTVDVEANAGPRGHRAGIVAAAAVAAAALGLTLVWQAAAGATASSTPVADASSAPTAGQVPASSVGAGLLALAWELTPPAQQDEVCARFSADPAAAWSAYSSAAQTVATRAEFTAFFRTSC
jgi:hypothetical protein